MVYINNYQSTGKCNKSLQTSNALSHQGNIYCSPCHKHVSAISGAIVPGQTPLSAGYTGLPVSGGDFRMRSNSVSSIPSESVRRSSVGVYSSRPARKVGFQSHTYTVLSYIISIIYYQLLVRN